MTHNLEAAMLRRILIFAACVLFAACHDQTVSEPQTSSADAKLPSAWIAEDADGLIEFVVNRGNSPGARFRPATKEEAERYTSSRFPLQKSSSSTIDPVMSSSSTFYGSIRFLRWERAEVITNYQGNEAGIMNAEARALNEYGYIGDWEPAGQDLEPGYVLRTVQLWVPAATCQTMSDKMIGESNHTYTTQEGDPLLVTDIDEYYCESTTCGYYIIDPEDSADCEQGASGPGGTADADEDDDGTVEPHELCSYLGLEEGIYHVYIDGEYDSTISC